MANILVTVYMNVIWSFDLVVSNVCYDLMHVQHMYTKFAVSSIAESRLYGIWPKLYVSLTVTVTKLYVSLTVTLCSLNVHSSRHLLIICRRYINTENNVFTMDYCAPCPRSKVLAILRGGKLNKGKNKRGQIRTCAWGT